MSDLAKSGLIRRTQADADSRIKRSAARLSLVSNFSLLVLKLGVGLWSGSVSVLAEAAHSATDLFASAIALFSVQFGDLPPDDDHPYGHGNVESISTLAQGILLSGVAGFVVYEAVEHIVRDEGPTQLAWPIVVMLLSAVTNVFVIQRVLKAAKQTGSLALQAVSKDHQADILAACGVLLGLLLVSATGQKLFDPIFALAVALLIFRSAWHLLRDAVRMLMDSHLPPEEIALVEKILRDEPQLLGYHKLRTRKSGSIRHIDAHILLDDHLTLLEAHDITERVEDRIREALPQTQITLHTEPFHAESQHQEEAHKPT